MGMGRTTKLTRIVLGGFSISFLHDFFLCSYPALVGSPTAHSFQGWPGWGGAEALPVSLGVIFSQDPKAVKVKQLLLRVVVGREGGTVWPMPVVCYTLGRWQQDYNVINACGENPCLLYIFSYGVPKPSSFCFSWYASLKIELLWSFIQMSENDIGLLVCAMHCAWPIF